MTTELRTDDPTRYAVEIEVIKSLLWAGEPVYVDLIDRITRYPLVITPKDGMVFWGTPDGVPGAGWYVLAWPEHGSMWWALTTAPHWSYVAEKLRLRYDFDQVAAETITAFMASLTEKTA